MAVKLNAFYKLFFFLLPFSIEYELPGGLGTDLPSEPLMIVLSGVCILLLLWHRKSKRTGFITHPISLVLTLHVLWIGFSTVYSNTGLFSIKFLLAKIWYVLPFYVLPFLIFREEKDYRGLFKYFLAGLIISVVYVMIRHMGMGFGFDSINDAVRPIYRNHVNYGVLLVSILPFMVYISKAGKLNVISTTALTGTLLLAIYLTYTRAAHISVILGILVYLVIHFRMVKPALFLSAAAIIFLSAYLAYDNKYLDFAPEYTKAIEHKKFDNLVEATTKMEDISTVERFYRWIAGVNMVREKPLTGFGPASFYSEYKAYTVSSYKTYVSDNPEKSGIHNYYLMTAVEQGLPGLLIFLVLAILPVIYAERAYHALEDPESRNLVMAAGVSFVVILAVLLINDLLEADKVGPLFFLDMAIIVHMYRKSRRKEA